VALVRLQPRSHRPPHDRLVPARQKPAGGRQGIAVQPRLDRRRRTRMNTLRPRVERAMSLVGALVVGGVLMGALAARGAGGGGGGETSPSTVSPTAGPLTETVEPTEPEVTDMPDETPYLGPSMGREHSDAKAAMTITGTVEAGVEAGCLVMAY